MSLTPASSSRLGRMTTLSNTAGWTFLPSQAALDICMCSCQQDVGIQPATGEGKAPSRVNHPMLSQALPSSTPFLHRHASHQSFPAPPPGACPAVRPPRVRMSAEQKPCRWSSAQVTYFKGRSQSHPKRDTPESQGSSLVAGMSRALAGFAMDQLRNRSIIHLFHKYMLGT